MSSPNSVRDNGRESAIEKNDGMPANRKYGIALLLVFACLVWSTAAFADFAEAPDERRLRQGLRLAAKDLGIGQVRLVVEVQEDGDTITMSTRPNGQDDVPWYGLEVATGPILAKMEYRRGQGELDAAAVECLKQALTAACARLYGPDANANGQRATQGQELL